MKTAFKLIVCGGLILGALGSFLTGCSDKSDNIPTVWEGIEPLMVQGWAQYASADFSAARQTFLEANQRNAFYLPAYNGLGWCAVRLTNFADAEVQFSFITTSATDTTLLADAYAGLCLSSAIERSVLEISGEGGSEQLQELAQESISRAQIVFDLLGEDYSSTDMDHDSLSSQSLHLLNAQNYFYLQEFEESEAELSAVDPSFVPDQLVIYGTSVSFEAIELVLEEVDQDTSWYLNPLNPGIHNYTEIVPPDSLMQLDYDIIYDGNRIQVFPAEGTLLEEDLEFIVSYVYIEDFAGYLYNLIEYIEELIEF